MEKTDNLTLEEIKGILKIYHHKFPIDINYSLISKAIDINQQHPRFRAIQKFLLKKGVFIERGKLGPSIMLTIDKRQLKAIIPEIYLMRFVNDEVMKPIWGSGYWTYD